MRYLKNRSITGRSLAGVALALLVGMTACDTTSLFQVTNPGRILDEDLNDPKIVTPLVVGMAEDLAEVLEDAGMEIAILSDEAAGSGSYYDTGLFRRGEATSEESDEEYQDLHEARWVAETGIERMQDIDGYTFDGNPLTARAYLLAGLSNRYLGEWFCDVTYDGSPPVGRDSAFNRAITYFEGALAQATQAGDADLANAARGAMAAAHLALTFEDPANATTHYNDAETDATALLNDADGGLGFEYVAYYDINPGEENLMYQETHERHEFSGLNTYADTVLFINGINDPRVPMTDCSVPGNCSNAVGADGTHIHYRQEKYPEAGSDIPMVKGTEAALILAEVALGRDDDFATAMTWINQVRTYYGVPTLTATNSAEAWIHLQHERFLTNWLEARRLYDLKRWDHPFLQGGILLPFYAPAENPRASCYPIGQAECDQNPNLTNNVAPCA